MACSSKHTCCLKDQFVVVDNYQTKIKIVSMCRNSEEIYFVIKSINFTTVLQEILNIIDNKYHVIVKRYCCDYHYLTDRNVCVVESNIVVKF